MPSNQPTTQAVLTKSEIELLKAVNPKRSFLHHIHWPCNQKDAFDPFGQDDDKRDGYSTEQSLEIRNVTFSFVSCIKYHQEVPFPPIHSDICEFALKSLTDDTVGLIGVREVADQLSTCLAPFQNYWRGMADIPRGFLFWGPPGTGKTSVVKYLCRFLNVHLVCDPITPAFFNQGIVGDSEKMMDTLAQWSKLIPWQMCVLAVDEIDGLAPDRTAHANHGGKDKLDLVGLLLGYIGGIKDVPNLALFGSTNIIHSMDEAFLRRMNYKIFIGRTSFESRERWLRKIASEYKSLMPDKVEPFDVTDIKDEFLRATVNFSTDATRKSLILAADNAVAQRRPLTKKYVLKLVRDRAVMERVLFGGCYIPDLLHIGGFIRSKEFDSLNVIQDVILSVVRKEGGQFPGTPSGRIFVQLIDESSLRSRSSIAGRVELELEQVQLEVLANDDERNFLEAVGSLLQLLDRCQITDRSRFRWEVADHKEMTDIAEKMESCNFDRELASAVGLFRHLGKFLIDCADNNFRTRLKEGSIADILEETIKTEEQTSFIREFVQSRKKLFSRDSDSMSISERQEWFTENVRWYLRKKALQLIEALPVAQLSGSRKVETLKRGKKVKVFSKGDIIQWFLDFGFQINVHFIQLFDNGYLSARKALDEHRGKELLQQLMEEAENYPSSIIIFDLDSIAQIWKDPGGDSVVQRQELLAMTLQYIKDLPAVMDSSSKVWVAVISQDPFITKRYKETINWPRSAVESEFECEVCGEFFKSNDKSISCGTHRYDEIYNENEYREFMEKAKSAGNSELSYDKLYKKRTEWLEILEHSRIPVGELRYRCCGGSIFGKGCKPSAHSSM
ncbi:hypothetical protein HK098_001379 [Nowakowskiella sp. JEL0407]|nr:hypothetical protein HK098_001379 [Nowakowskiella sp. JEL0407]